jgi:hypothetical protein
MKLTKQTLLGIMNAAFEGIIVVDERGKVMATVVIKDQTMLIRWASFGE